jgi:hypothetical protein
MTPDPIIEEIRQIRDHYAAQFNYDLQAMYADLKQQESANPKPHHCFSAKSFGRGRDPLRLNQGLTSERPQ